MKLWSPEQIVHHGVSRGDWGQVAARISDKRSNRFQPLRTVRSSPTSPVLQFQQVRTRADILPFTRSVHPVPSRHCKSSRRACVVSGPGRYPLNLCWRPWARCDEHSFHLPFCSLDL
ncbi:hypothetical protein J6590_043328 [Homalodisca vitripennis]|nr:hypothetical protein J6590_043328 [Homalodisca vitripennis]